MIGLPAQCAHHNTASRNYKKQHTRDNRHTTQLEADSPQGQTCAWYGVPRQYRRGLECRSGMVPRQAVAHVGMTAEANGLSARVVPRKRVERGDGMH